MSAPKYKRILLKLGGEALAKPGGFGIDPDEAAFLADRVRSVKEMGVETALAAVGLLRLVGSPVTVVAVRCVR